MFCARLALPLPGGEGRRRLDIKNNELFCSVLDLHYLCRHEKNTCNHFLPVYYSCCGVSIDHRGSYSGIGRHAVAGRGDRDGHQAERRHAHPSDCADNHQPPGGRAQPGAVHQDGIRPGAQPVHPRLWQQDDLDRLCARHRHTHRPARRGPDHRQRARDDQGEL